MSDLDTNEGQTLPDFPRTFAPAIPQHQDRAQRQTLLIRSAKLVTSHGEFVCVIRDISETGVGLRLFHDVPTGDLVELHMPTGAMREIRQVRQNGRELGYQFTERINVHAFVNEVSAYPKRGMRLALFFPASLTVFGQRHEATVFNLSQQGARVYCEEHFAIDQAVSLECDWPEMHFGPVTGKVRWRRDAFYGLAFEETMKLPEFARLAAHLQCPAIVRSDLRLEKD